MALKNFLMSLANKSPQSDLEKKNNAVAALLTSENFPVIRTQDTDISKYHKVPLAGITAFGAAFASLPQAARTITQTITTNIATNEPVYIGLNPKGIIGKLQSGEYGINGNIMQINTQGKNVVRGRMQFKELSNGLPINQTTSTVVPFDPMTLAIAAALATIDKKLDVIQEKVEEILRFLTLDKQAKQRGDLDMLSEIMEDFKRDCNSITLYDSRITEVLRIKTTALGNIHFYQEQISNKLQKQKAIHGRHDAQNLIDSVAGELAEYQLACYICGFASFLDTLLRKDFESNSIIAVTDKLKSLSRQYSELFSKCCVQIENYQHKAVGAQLLGSIGKAADAVGKKIAEIPVLKKGPVDEILIRTGSSLEKHNKGTVEKDFEKISILEDSHVNEFATSLQSLDLIYNRHDGLLTDGENLYLLESV